MKYNLLSSVAITLLFQELIAFSPASAQVTCIQDHFASLKGNSLGIAPSEVSELISQIVKGIGLEPAGILTIPCDGVGKVRTYKFDQTDIPLRDYILYDPVWAREVIGSGIAVDVKSRDQAIVVFGHELGHILGRHFTTNKNLPEIKKESDADHFAGCAAGVMRAKWEHVEDILNRIRGDEDTDYPSRSNSVALAKDGFERCGRSVTKTSAKEVNFGPFFLNPGGARSLSVNLPSDGPVDVYVERLTPDWKGAGQQREGVGLAVSICSAESNVDTPCPHSQLGEGQVARRKVPAGPANIGVFNFNENPPVSISMKIVYPQ